MRQLSQKENMEKHMANVFLMAKLMTHTAKNIIQTLLMKKYLVPVVGHGF